MHRTDSLGRTIARTRRGLKGLIPNMGLVPKGGQILSTEGGGVTTPSRRRVSPQGAICGALGLRTPWILRVIPQGSIGGGTGSAHGIERNAPSSADRSVAQHFEEEKYGEASTIASGDDGVPFFSTAEDVRRLPSFVPGATEGPKVGKGGAHHDL